MFCSKCGNKVEGNIKFCSNCGNNLEVNNTAQGNLQYIAENPTINNYNSNSSQNNNGLAIASLIIGIVSVFLSFFINIFIFPISITGLILGIVNKNKCGQKVAGIILNSLSMVIALIILIASIFIIGFLADFTEEDFVSNPVSGVWNCKSFDGTGESDEYLITLKLDSNYNFSWSKYEDELDNHVYGTYTYIDENKTNYSGDYSYYMIDLVGEEFVSNGILQDQEYKSQYEMGINEEYGEAILMNVSTYNMYYCYLYSNTMTLK